MSRQTIPFLPAACPQCGAIFRSRLISVIGCGNIRNLELRNNTESCPICGGIARTAEGVFDYTAGALEILTAPDVTLDMLRKLRVILQSAYIENAPLREVQRQAEAISPRFGKLFEPKQWPESIHVAWIGALGLIVASAIGLLQSSPNFTVNVQAIDVAELLAGAEARTAADILADANERRYPPMPKLKPAPKPPIPRLKPRARREMAGAALPKTSRPERDRGTGKRR